MRSCLLCLCAAFLLAGAAVAQPDYAIRSYDIRIEPDFASRSVRIRATIAIDNPARLMQFEFGSDPAYRLSLKSRPVGASMQAGEGVVTVRLPKPADHVLLEFDSVAEPGNSSGEDRPAIDADSLFLLWSDRWYPIDFEHWAPVRTTVVLPTQYEVIAPGRIVSQRTSGNVRTTVFKERNPAVTFSVFADRRWVEEDRTIGRFRIRTLLHPGSRKWVDTIFSTAPDVLNFFSDLHGAYPFEQFAFVTLEGTRARRAFTGFIGYSPSYLDLEMDRTGYDAHETSLLWWDLATRGRGPGSWQWTEGLGDYMEALYAERRDKPLAAIFARFREQYLATPPEKDVLHTELRGNTPQPLVHGKYPWLMHILRLGIGDDAFLAGVRLLFARYSRRTFSMEEFVQVFESASNSSLDWWRKDWLESRGPATASFTADIGADVSGFRVRLNLRQIGLPRRIPAEIGLRTSSGMEVRRVTFDATGKPLEITVRERPLEVVFDPGKRLPVRLVSSEAVPSR